jgi:type I restriction enzyme S subunit
MTKELNKKMKLDLDKSDWTLTRLGDLANDISERVNDPSTSEYDRFVGLEHIVSGDLKIKGWKTTDGLASSAKAFKAGDVLFARRNAYLRRASMVDFDGCCSGDAFVLRENHEKIVPGFLAFIVNSERLWDYANSNAAGTMSKRVKWRDLANYEFLLPPKPQQAQLAELLWAMDEVVEKEKLVGDQLFISSFSNRKYFIENGVSQNEKSKKIRFGRIASEWKTNKLKNVCELIGGNAFKSSKFKDTGQYQVLRIGNITTEGIDPNKSPVFVEDITPNEQKYMIPKGAIVMSLTGTNGKRDYGFPSLMKENNKYLLNQRLVMVVCNKDKVLPEFLHLVTQMELFQAKFFLNATGTANQANVSISDIAKIGVPIPPLRDQASIIDKMQKFWVCITKSKQRIQHSKSLQKSLINQIF